MGLFDIFKKKEEKKEFDGSIYAPFDGKFVPLSEVPDEVFAGKMVGDGIAIEPTASGNIVAPVSGEVTKIFDTNHAFSIVTKDNIEVLVHFGVDTVSLNGKGLERLVKEGDKVEKGTPIIKFDYDYLKEHAKSVITPVIITNYEEFVLSKPQITTVVAGETCVLEVKQK